MIGSSLSLITHALAKLNIHLPTSPTTGDVPQETTIPNDTRNRYLPLTAEPIIPQPEGQHFDPSGAFQASEFHNLDLENFDISPEVLDAFSALEPIDATVGALYDLI